VAQRNLSRYVFDELRARILDGRLVAGAPISEREIGAELDVSRVPIREAMPLLEAAGLVTLEPRRPAVVTPVTRTSVDELYDVRAVLEPFIARRAAAAVAAGADPADLKAALDLAGIAAHQEDWDVFHHRSGQVHLEIERLAENTLFVAVMEPLRERSNRLNVANMRTDPTARHAEHADLVDTIARGQVDLASAVAFTHVEWGRERILHTLESVPGYDPDR
jgi:DNA-binding GntR family transcriptional regulator